MSTKPDASGAEQAVVVRPATKEDMPFVHKMINSGQQVLGLRWNLKNGKHVLMPIMMLMHHRVNLTPLLTGELALTELGQQMLRLRRKLKNGKHVFLSITKVMHYRELAAYEGVPDGCELTIEELIEDGFTSSPPWFFTLVALAGEELVGYALCNRAYSSWSRRALYVEDIYVRPERRRGGAGMALFKEICRIGMEMGAHRVDWHVLESNAPALAFYARLGARDLRVTEGRAALRLDREHIERIAKL